MSINCKYHFLDLHAVLQQLQGPGLSPDPDVVALVLARVFR